MSCPLDPKLALVAIQSPFGFDGKVASCFARTCLSALPTGSQVSTPWPPARPALKDCCKGSCDPCIFDLYEEALARYESDLQAWVERHDHRKEVP